MRRQRGKTPLWWSRFIEVEFTAAAWGEGGPGHYTLTIDVVTHQIGPRWIVKSPPRTWRALVERLAEIDLFDGAGEERGERVAVLSPGHARKRMRAVELDDPSLYADLVHAVGVQRHTYRHRNRGGYGQTVRRGAGTATTQA